MEKVQSKQDLMELLASESVRTVREGILKYLAVTETPSIIGHAAIVSLADDIHRNENKQECENLESLVATFHEKVAVAKAAEESTKLAQVKAQQEIFNSGGMN